MKDATACPGHNRALCCECGALRTVSATYKGPGPSYAEQEGWQWLRDLRCATCRTITRHATLNDSGEFAGRDWAEEDNREADRIRRVIRRRVAGLVADGLEVERRADAMVGQTCDDPFPLSAELWRNGPLVTVRVGLWEGAEPKAIVKALDHLERLLDDAREPIVARLKASPCGLAIR